jgi:hypothetical protein
MIEGGNWFPSDWRVPAMAITNLKMVTAANAAPVDLFVVDQTGISQGYVWGIHVSKLTMEGSSIVGSRGMYLKNVASSLFADIGILKFDRGIEVEFGMMNEFNRINSSKCGEASFYLNGVSITTTQTFNRCVARESQWGWIMQSTATGNSIGTVLNGCLLESTTVGGVSQHKSCAAEYNSLYAENCPDDRQTTVGTMFNLFKDGVDVDPYRSTAFFNGGDLAGGNFNKYTDSNVMNIGSAKLVVVNGTSFKRATNGIRWDDTTADNAIQLTMPNFVQVTNLYLGGPSSKLSGIYPDKAVTGNAATILAALLKFPAVQKKSTDPNTLDDYAEGTWTGLLTPDTGTITQSYKTGYYTKVGRLVTVTGLFVPSAVAAPTGILRLKGLPFKAAAGGGGEVAATVSARYLTGAAGFYSVDGVVQAGADNIEIALFTTAGNPQPMAAKVAVGSEIRVNLTYMTD